MTQLETLFFFEPYYKSVIWGGDKISALKRLVPAKTQIGESWEISAVPGHESIVAQGDFKGTNITDLIKKFGPLLVGQHAFDTWGYTFPLLVKIIDAKENLSVQVHPDDSLANELHNTKGKTEMWYVIDAEEDSKIFSGFSAKRNCPDVSTLLENSSIVDSLASFSARKGEFYYIPAGTIHAIGAGTMVAEIQETSDISYRIYDYNRVDKSGEQRPLHIANASKALDFNSKDCGPIALPSSTELGVVESEFFKIDFYKPEGNVSAVHKRAHDSFSIIMAVHGDLECKIGEKDFLIRKGSTALVPACVKEYLICAHAPYLIVSMPSPSGSDE